MSLVSFDTLPDDARLWCFGASRPPSSEEEARLVDALRRFVSEWTAHSRNLRAGIDWRDQRFLLIAVDESHAGASGCSIDTLTGRLRELGSELGLDLLDSLAVWYRDAAGRVRSCARHEFRTLGEQGQVTDATSVFDITLTRVGDARAGRFELPAGESWHRTLLRRA
jgi:hypothetical protein